MRINRTYGFTLMEVMLAVAVSAVVLAAIGGVFFSSLRLRERTFAVLDESLPIERALTLMSRDLKNAVPPGTGLAGPLQSGVVTSGVTEPGGIQMYTTTGLMSDQAPWPEIQKVSYQLQPATNRTAAGQDLYRSVTRNLLPTTMEESEAQWLAGGIADLRFTYFDGTSWLETWDSITQTNMPFAVRVEVRLARHNGPNYAPLQMVVPLLAQSRTNMVSTAEEETSEN